MYNISTILNTRIKNSLALPMTYKVILNNLYSLLMLNLLYFCWNILLLKDGERSKSVLVLSFFLPFHIFYSRRRLNCTNMPDLFIFIVWRTMACPGNCAIQQLSLILIQTDKSNRNTYLIQKYHSYPSVDLISRWFKEYWRLTTSSVFLSCRITFAH